MDYVFLVLFILSVIQLPQEDECWAEGENLIDSPWKDWISKAYSLAFQRNYFQLNNSKKYFLLSYLILSGVPIKNNCFIKWSSYYLWKFPPSHQNFFSWLLEIKESFFLYCSMSMKQNIFFNENNIFLSYLPDGVRLDWF